MKINSLAILMVNLRVDWLHVLINNYCTFLWKALRTIFFHELDFWFFKQKNLAFPKKSDTFLKSTLHAKQALINLIKTKMWFSWLKTITWNDINDMPTSINLQKFLIEIYFQQYTFKQLSLHTKVSEVIICFKHAGV